MRAHKQVHQPVAVRRSQRQVPRTSMLGVFEDSLEMEGKEESSETKTEDEYNPKEICCVCVVDLEYVWNFCLGW